MVVEPVMAAVNSEICDGNHLTPEQKEAAGCNVDKDAGTVASSVIQVVLGFIGVIAVGVMILWWLFVSDELWGCWESQTRSGCD